MQLTKITKSLCLILTIGIISISIVIFIKNELPAQERKQPVTPGSIKPATSSIESQIDTSDWEIYRNEVYGFEFKYPKEYKQYFMCQPGFSGGPPSSDGLSEGAVRLGNNIRLTISPKIRDDISEQVNTSIRLDVEQQGGKIEAKEIVHFGEYEGIKLGYTDRRQTCKERVFIRKNGWDFIFRLEDCEAPSCAPQLSGKGFTEGNIFTSVLGTFRFTK